MTGLGSSCGACKFLRRRCTSECVFAPYFCYDEAAAHFAAVHKVFGASNVSKLLSHLPMHSRSEAAISISYEALARMQDPIYGCVAQIFALQQQVAILQEEIETLEYQIANLGFDVSGFEHSQAFNNELQVPFQHTEMNALTYLGQQSPVFHHEVDIWANHSLYDQMNVQLPIISGFEEQTYIPCSNLSPLEELLQLIDQGTFACYSRINNGSNIN